ncbi:MSHA biogenesis protein MshJ [Photobacterium aquae]|uniref:MSHA biogenesis protein MshJ n=1 Tax=Photobacterium aquae TaxID=1195763 RepID=A0A0J1H2T2_9GAMM|nr:type II secretion system protein GspM [Photobacterium aquae]KLV06154.1 MSHA biogenesis protein MshJ [Photobacterium aquae]
MNMWQQLCEKFDGLTRREQGLIALTGWVAVLFIGFVAVIEPQIQSLDHAEQRLVMLSQAVTNSDNQLLLVKRRLKQDPDQELDTRIRRLNAENAELDTQLAERVGSLVSPAEMPVLLEKVLAHSERLKLVALSSLPPEQLQSGEQGGFYIHRVKLILRGRYFDVVDYLNQLESLPVKYYWQSLDYKVNGYPWADVELVVYTLGESRDFIGG